MPGPSMFCIIGKFCILGVGHKFAPTAAFFAKRYPLFQGGGGFFIIYPHFHQDINKISTVLSTGYQQHANTNFSVYHRVADHMSVGKFLSQLINRLL